MAKEKNVYDTDNYYFIDYENVTKEGLNGLEKLGKNDRVRVYYGRNAAHIPFELHIKISECKAEFEYVKVEFNIKNALDCMILYDIRTFAGAKNVGNYFIVSKDSDFDDPIETFRKEGLSIFKTADIASASDKVLPKKQKAPAKQEKKTSDAPEKSQKEKKRENKVRTFFGQQFKDKKYKDNKERIIAAVIGSKNRAQLNNELQKIYGNGDVKEMLKTLKPLTNELYK